MKITILQLDFKVGDFEGNTRKILREYQDAVQKRSSLVVTSELALFGYPPGDMLLRNDYLKQQNRHLDYLSQHIGKSGLIIGVATQNPGGAGMPLHNSAVLIQDKKIIYLQHKTLLPNYDVFDEKRYFEASTRAARLIEYNGHRIGVLICEDIWSDVETIAGNRMYRDNPVDVFLDWRKSAGILISV
jgi:NAD+ synthase (glutamine-hydrolysing)